MKTLNSSIARNLLVWWWVETKPSLQVLQNSSREVLPNLTFYLCARCADIAQAISLFHYDMCNMCKLSIFNVVCSLVFRSWIQLHLIVCKPIDQTSTNLFCGSYYNLDIICDRKRGITICIASKVDCLQYQEHVTHKYIEQRRIQYRA